MIDLENFVYDFLGGDPGIMSDYEFMDTLAALKIKNETIDDETDISSTAEKECVICGALLANRRTYKRMCDPCGGKNANYIKQFNESLKIVDAGKNEVTCFYRSMFACNLINKMDRYFETGVAAYIGGLNADEQFKYFHESMNAFLGTIKEQNENRIYDKKIGVPMASFNPSNSPGYEDGRCKACFESVYINKAGYCHACIRRATRVNADDLNEYVKAKGMSATELRAFRNLDGQQIFDEIAEYKLHKN